MPVESITCPRCGTTSHNPNDVANGYCGHCHDFTSGYPSRLAWEEFLRTGEIPEWRKRALIEMATQEALKEVTCGHFDAHV